MGPIIPIIILGGAYLLGCSSTPAEPTPDAGQIDAAADTNPPDSPTPTDAVPPPISPPWLHVDGRNIVNERGALITLVGAESANNEWNAEYPMMMAPAIENDSLFEADFRRMHELGFNATRFAINYRWFEDQSNPGHFNEQGFRDLATRIAWARQHGIYLILAMHYDYQISERGIPIWSGPGEIPDRQSFLIQLWQEIARRHSDESAIAGFDLLNEPRPPRDTDWQSLAQRLTAAIREVDRNHIIFVPNSLTETAVPGSPWQIRPFLVRDTNVVYTGHSYDPLVLTHQGLPWAYNRDDGTPWAPPGAHYPARAVESGTYVGGYYDAPGNIRTTDWTRVQTPWATLPATANIGRISLQSVSDRGQVWMDDISLEAMAPDGTISEIPINNDNFSLPTPYVQYSPEYGDFNFRSFSSFLPFWQIADTGVREGRPQLINYLNPLTANIAWDQTIGHTAPGSIRFNQCQHCAAVTNFTTNSFEIRAGHQYRISYWIRAEGTGGDMAWNFAAFDASNGRFVEWNRDYLRQILSFFHDWAAANNVPFFLGEFGAVGNFPDHDDQRWVTDMLSIAHEFGFHWNYFNWRGPHPVDLDFSLVRGTATNPFMQERTELLGMLSRAARSR